MRTVIDSLFLELGFDISKMPAQQRQALEKIRQFESEATKAGKKSKQAIATVGEAFRDIASDSAVGGASRRLDTFATKLKILGQTAQVSGGAGTPLGKMAEGLGALLSPASLGVAALGLLGMAAWDFNKKMTAANATVARQAQLSGINAKNLWAWGQAAQTIGGSPQDVTGGIASLQTSIAGMGIGAGNASSQLVALARLGKIGWNFQTGANIPQLFERVHQLAAQRGFQNLGALRALTAPLMNDAMFAIATNPTYSPDQLQRQIKGMEPKNFGTILRRSLESQTQLGKMDIQKAVLAETAYGGIQKPMQTLVGMMTNLLAAVTSMLGWTIKIADGIADIWKFIRHPFDKNNPVAKAVKDHLQNNLIAHGVKPKVAAQAAATATPVIGQAAKDDLKLLGEEMFAPYVLMQKTPALVAAEIVKWMYRKPAGNKGSFGASLASSGTSLGNAAMAPGTLVGLEIFGTRSDIAGYLKMLSAANSPRVLQHTTTHHTKIGAVHVATQATDAKGMAAGARKALSSHPLIAPTAQNTVALSSRGMAG